MTIELDATLSSLEAYGVQWAHEEQDDVQSLSDLVKDKIQDTSYTHDVIVALFNRCLRRVSGRHRLEELETHEQVLTDPRASSIPLPANYQRDLNYCHSISHNRKIKVHGAVVQMYRQFSQLDQYGRVIGVAVKGRELFYQRVPETAEILRIRYYRYPDRLRDRYDKPTCIPEHLVEDLLVNYACWKIYSEIEDGIEGTKVNTTYYKGEFREAEAELSMFLGPDEDEPEEFPEEIDWEAYL